MEPTETEAVVRKLFPGALAGAEGVFVVGLPPYEIQVTPARGGLLLKTPQLEGPPQAYARNDSELIAWLTMARWKFEEKALADLVEAFRPSWFLVGALVPVQQASRAFRAMGLTSSEVAARLPVPPVAGDWVGLGLPQSPCIKFQCGPDCMAAQIAIPPLGVSRDLRITKCSWSQIARRVFEILIEEIG